MTNGSGTGCYANLTRSVKLKPWPGGLKSYLWQPVPDISPAPTAMNTEIASSDTLQHTHSLLTYNTPPLTFSLPSSTRPLPLSRHHPPLIPPHSHLTTTPSSPSSPPHPSPHSPSHLTTTPSSPPSPSHPSPHSPSHLTTTPSSLPSPSSTVPLPPVSSAGGKAVPRTVTTFTESLDLILVTAFPA